MTNGAVEQPAARARHRTGRRPLDWSYNPTSDEALIDALRIKISGSILLPEGTGFETFIRSIAGGLLRAPMTPGRLYTSDLREQLTVSGKFIFRERRGASTFSAILNLNPTRTLHRALDAAQRRPLAALAPRTFFSAMETLTDRSPEYSGRPNPEPTLDGKDNILPTPEHMGGTWPEGRARFQTDYLAVFEEKLKALIVEAITPQAVEINVSPGGCRATTKDGVVVELDWHKLIVQRAEVYWERDAADAPAVARRMMDGGLTLARNIRATKYAASGAHYEVDQQDGFPSLLIPLTGRRTILLNLYAKTRTRLRTEVRYVHDFNAVLRGFRSPTARLTLLLERLKEDAAHRLPWEQLGRLAQLPPNVGIESIPDLVARITTACRGHEGALEDVTRSLLMYGGLTADDGKIAGSEAIVARLERADVLERQAFQMKEDRTGRLHGLKEPYATARRKMLLGFAPVDTSTDPLAAPPAPNPPVSRSEAAATAAARRAHIRSQFRFFR